MRHQKKLLKLLKIQRTNQEVFSNHADLPTEKIIEFVSNIRVEDADSLGTLDKNFVPPRQFLPKPQLLNKHAKQVLREPVFYH